MQQIYNLYFVALGFWICLLCVKLTANVLALHEVADF